MRKIIMGVIMTAILAAGCATTAPQLQQQQQPQFSDVIGKEWKLTEVRINNENINFHRETLVSEGFGDIFTLNFDAQNISGVGAPNRYSAPYTLENNQGISVKLARATLMAPLREPEKLKEHDYFTYIQNAYTWRLTGTNLELRSKTDDGAEVVLIFSL
jgi:heat shock protein HslJ